jgi:hypothetical protein
MHLPFDLYDRWVLGAFDVVFGVFSFVSARRFIEICGFFRGSESTGGIDAAIERRKELEALSPLPWRVIGIVAILLGVVVLFNGLPGVASYGLICLTMAIALGTTYLRLRNRGERRAASLEPRAVTSVVTPTWLTAGVVCALAPLLFADDSRFRGSAIVVMLASLGTIAVAMLAAEMPALLTGEDVVAELYVDRRLRRVRVHSLFALGLGTPWVFCAGVVGYSAATPLRIFAYWFVLAAWIAFVYPLFFRRKEVPS